MHSPLFKQILALSFSIILEIPPIKPNCKLTLFNSHFNPFVLIFSTKVKGMIERVLFFLFNKFLDLMLLFLNLYLKEFV